MPADHTQYRSDVQPDTAHIPDDNLENFIDNWRHYRDRLVMFLGAGASVGAKSTQGETLPTAIELRDALWDKFMRPEPTDPRPGLMSLEHATALIEAKAGRGPLVEEIGRRFITAQTLWPHATLAWFKPRALYTTNYDTLIERGWQAHADLPDITPIFSPAQSRIPAGTAPLFKPHGCVKYRSSPVGEGGVVITQFDYFKMLTDKRHMLQSFLTSMDAHCVLFIGYSFNDMDIASMLYEMRSRDRDIHWYAVLPRNDADVKAMYLYNFGIRQISRKFSDFAAQAGSRLGLIPPGWRSELPFSPLPPGA